MYRNLIFIAFFLLVGCSVSKVSKIEGKSDGYIPFAQFNGDTLAYLHQNFEVRKEVYIGQSVEKLLKDLELPINLFDSNALPNNRYHFNRFLIYFYEKDNREKTEIIKYSMIVSISNLLDKSEFDNLGFDWDIGHYEKLKNEVIKEVVITSYKGKVW